MSAKLLFNLKSRQWDLFDTESLANLKVEELEAWLLYAGYNLYNPAAAHPPSALAAAASAQSTTGGGAAWCRPRLAK